MLAEALRNNPDLENKIDIQIVDYQPRDRKDIQKLFNNLYVKNFPDTWQEENIQALFSQFGVISSIFMLPNDIGKAAFITYGGDRDEPSKSALRAMQELNDKEVEGCKLYVKPALSKKEREIEKQKNMLRYKNSKKRCNLYVKNFA